jgi:hypothetical protein
MPAEFSYSPNWLSTSTPEPFVNALQLANSPDYVVGRLA